MSNDEQDSDEQDGAESVDEEMLGEDAVTSDERGSFDDAPLEPVGLPFADADVTDESVAQRAAREEPEVWEGRTTATVDDPDVIVDSDLVEHVDDDGDLAEPDD
jgi:hypothetical protein